MCQYSAEEGNPTKWHYGHLQQLAFSGAGMVMMESTAVNDDGRITLKDLTIKDQKNEHTLKKVVSYIKNLNKLESLFISFHHQKLDKILINH